MKPHRPDRLEQDATRQRERWRRARLQSERMSAPRVAEEGRDEPLLPIGDLISEWMGR